MTAFPAGEEQREFQYKSDCEIYTRTLHGWSRAAMKSSKICPILAHQVFGTVEEFFRGCGSNSERLGRAVTLDHHDPWISYIAQQGSRLKRRARGTSALLSFWLWLPGLCGLFLLRSQLRPARPLRRSNLPSGCCRHSSFARVHRAGLTFRGVLRSQSCPPRLLRERNFPSRSCGQSPTRPTRSASHGRSLTYSR